MSRGVSVEEVHDYKLLVDEWISRLLLAPSEWRLWRSQCCEARHDTKGRESDKLGKVGLVCVHSATSKPTLYNENL
jgi:hypothetical protein